MNQAYFAAVHNNRGVTNASSSGGAFTAITDKWFSLYGEKAVIYGCVLDQELRARHIRGIICEDRDRMRGSKYIGSNLSGIFPRVASDLSGGLYVIFSGTPCQIGGLNAYLNALGVNKEDRLLTVEVICHGVGSVLFFDEYIRYLERRYASKAVSCNFRTKKSPWQKQDMQVIFENGRMYQAASTRYDWFYSVYHRNLILRPSCLHCGYARKERCADISLGDYWGDAKGEIASRSLVISNTLLGLRWTEAALEDMEYEKISWEQVLQPHMHRCVEKPEEYDAFWDEFRRNGYDAAQRFVGNNTPHGRLRSMVVTLLYLLHLKEAAKRARNWLKGKVSGK